jgi:Xaa-Pro aminopeptidase
VLWPDGRESLCAAPEHPDDVVWRGPQLTLDAHAAAAGIAHTCDLAKLAAELASLKQEGAPIHYLPPYRAERRQALADLLSRPLAQVDGEVSSALVSAVFSQREIKSTAEIAEIEDALAVTARMYEVACQQAQPGVTEAQIAGAIQAVALQADRQQAFAPIVSIHGEVLHNTSYANTLADGQLLVIDSGAESSGNYASDITRTLPVSGTFAPKQMEIYEVVLAAQQAVIEMAAPGVTNRELHLKAARVIAAGLQQIGLMKGDPEEAVAAGAHALFFPHGIGHMLGLDVHDMEDLGDAVGYNEGESRSKEFGLCYLRLAKTLRPGFVITVEPGCYFIPALLDRWQATKQHADFIDYSRVETYRGFGGIRIEDDVLVTEDGSRILGFPIPKSVPELAAAMTRP